MITIEVTYSYDDGVWGAGSADMHQQLGHGLTAGDRTYAKTRATVEEIVPWSLERDDVVIEHFIEESSIPQYLAERETAERAAAGKPTTAAKS